MGLVVLPALLSDISVVYDVYFAAFANHPVTRALFPSATTEELLDPTSEFRQTHTAHTHEYNRTCSTQYTTKCIDTSTGRVIGMALWDIYLTPSTWEPPGIPWLSGTEREHAEALLTPLWSARDKLWKGKRYLYCHVTAVHPEYQRLGVGQKLVEWGIAVATQAGLPIYVESSQEGLRMYEKLGFCRLKMGVEQKVPNGVAQEQDEQGVPLLVWCPEGKKEGLSHSLIFA